jgi:hypothetical protein
LSFVRRYAVENPNLTDQALLADIAKNDKSNDVREAAVAKLNDQALLADIAKHDKDEDVREAEGAFGRKSSGTEEVDIVALTRAKDIEGLLRAFSLSQDWKGRELVVVALQVIFKDAKGNDNFQSNAMVSALKDIIMLCKAETSGGSYRENCIDCAQKLLEHFK